jgi:hypothetical protein
VVNGLEIIDLEGGTLPVPRQLVERYPELKDFRLPSDRLSDAGSNT